MPVSFPGVGGKGHGEGRGHAGSRDWHLRLSKHPPLSSPWNRLDRSQAKSGSESLRLKEGLFPSWTAPRFGKPASPPRALAMLLTKDGSGPCPPSDFWTTRPVGGRAHGPGGQSARSGVLHPSPHMLWSFLAGPPTRVQVPPSSRKLSPRKQIAGGYYTLGQGTGPQWTGQSAVVTRGSETDFSCHLQHELRTPGRSQPPQSLTLQARALLSTHTLGDCVTSTHGQLCDLLPPSLQPLCPPSAAAPILLLLRTALPLLLPLIPFLLE